ncbi:MAG: hypothetical protein AUK63_832 [bacterium P3]|nr:MAG: hypothetical protein AUK63_832 [bacterium P3]KWW41458.1 MAG: hypothetical protein F083_1020 [bacterium F083]
MNTLSLSPADLRQLETMGITPEQLEMQMQHFRQGFPHCQLVSAATVENGGIIRMPDDDISKYISCYQQLSKGKRILKFVPASGAASRMFKDLYDFTARYTGVAHNFEKEFPSVVQFLDNLTSFAFFNDLKDKIEETSMSISDYMEHREYASIINILLKDQYLSYGSMPKALLKFHRYGDLQRTPLEEHIVEGAEYARNSDGKVRLHFTISPEHRPLFRHKVALVRRYYEEMLHIKLEIGFSEQRHSTDTLAVNECNEPVRDENGRLVLRPGGHGALLENLNECHADVVFIKNIDNVVPDWMKHTTVAYKKALAGLLLDLQRQYFPYLQALSHNTVDGRQLDSIAHFARNGLQIELPEGFDKMPADEQRQILYDRMNRPIRICGMVKNQGEPGGGPFFVFDSEGRRSLQIVETAQINRKDPAQESILAGATHFNPVDIVCSFRDYRGRYFDLHRYVDPNTGFISKKSKGAQVVKSQELPGLWNGSMAKWITLFVEVPLATFNPVKTVNDLLRKEHCGQ